MLPDRPTMAELITRQGHLRETHPLLVCDAERLDYAGAERRSAVIARGLIALGAGKGTHVGLLYPNGEEFVVAMLAAARIGAVAVPFTTFATGRELGEQLSDADVAILLATRAYRSHDYVRRCREALGLESFDLESSDVSQQLFTAAAPQLRHVAFDLEHVARLADAVDPALLSSMEDDVDGSDPLAIVYTSGSTGAPKGAVHTHSSLLRHQENLNLVRRLTAADRLFCNSPFFWIGGLAFGLFATIVAGSTLVCSNATDPADTLDLLEAERPTIANGFTATVAHLARHDTFARRDLSAMRRGNLYPIMPADARPADPELRHNMLGMTEAGSTLLISADESDQPEERRGSFGKPAPGFEIEVADPETQVGVEEGALGELRIRGPHLMQRYHRRSREECFDADGWFATGDLVCLDVDGYVYFIGRRGAMIKTAGANVTPAEVEKVVCTVTGGAVSHVIGIPDPDRGEVVGAAIVLNVGEGFDEDALRAALSSQLSAYKVPRRIIGVAAADVPLLSSGKVDTRRLRSLFDV
jgi:acyl-CoA synthetase (AMP-forming)/AMP-acid ligase II